MRTFETIAILSAIYFAACPATLIAQDRSDESDSSAAATTERIELFHDYETALSESRLKQRPVLVLLGAQWCTWCKKLEAELETDAADSILQTWVIVKVDVDASPDIAERLDAYSLPALRILGLDETAIASTEGYMPLPELEQWLSPHILQANPSIQRVLFKQTALTDEEMKTLTDLLGNRATDIRVAAEQKLIELKSQAAPSVIDLVRDGRLAQQLGAISVLVAWNAPVEGIDPWLPESIDDQALAKLSDWQTIEMPAIINEGENDGDDDGEISQAEPDSIDPEMIDQSINELLNAAPDDRPAIVSRAAAYGPQIAAAIRLRLADSPDLTDSQRVVLRELLYRGLASPKVRLEQSRLFPIMASLDSETHRQAIETVLPELQIDDGLLIDELSRDNEPLVREQIIPKCKPSDGFNSPTR